MSGIFLQESLICVCWNMKVSFITCCGTWKYYHCRCLLLATLSDNRSVTSNVFCFVNRKMCFLHHGIAKLSLQNKPPKIGRWGFLPHASYLLNVSFFRSLEHFFSVKIFRTKKVKIDLQMF